MRYILTATAELEAADAVDAQGKLNGISRALADGDGEYGENWEISAEEPPPQRIRNDRLWHAAHDFHAANRPVKVIRSGKLILFGYITEMNDRVFFLQEVGSDNPSFVFQFTDMTLRLEV